MAKRKAARGPTSPLAHRRAAPRSIDPPDELIKAAQASEAATGVPTSVTLSQWAVESGYGAHSPANNPFGIKAVGNEPSTTQSTLERSDDGSHLVRKPQNFRAFDSLDDAVKAHADLLAKHYPLAMAHVDDPEQFVSGLEADPSHMYAGGTDAATNEAAGQGYVKLLTSVMHSRSYKQYDGVYCVLDTKDDPDLIAGAKIRGGEPTVMLGFKNQMAAHVDTPHTGGGQVAEGSSSVFVGADKKPFARLGDKTTDELFVRGNVQDDIFIGGGTTKQCDKPPPRDPSSIDPYAAHPNGMPAFQPK